MLSEIASLNLKCGPPFSAMNPAPSISNVAVSTVPAGIGAPSP